MKARDIMTSSPSTVTLTDTVARTAEMMRDLSVGCIPVVDDGEVPVLLGLITDRDIAVRCVADSHLASEHVRDFMTRAPLKTVGPDDDVSDVVQKMEEAQVRRIPVVNDDGVLLGIIAQADLATKLGPKEPRTIEELVERISAAPAVPV